MLLSNFPRLLDSLAAVGAVEIVTAFACFSAAIACYRLLVTRILGGGIRV